MSYVPSVPRPAGSAHALRLGLLALVVLLLQIPMMLIHGLVGERQARRAEAVQEVAGKWGQAQRLAGPWITVPFSEQFSETDVDGRTVIRRRERSVTFLPESLSASGTVAHQVRHRGIFEVPVYRLRLDLRGEFTAPDPTQWSTGTIEPHWDRAHLSLQVADPSAIAGGVTLGWDGSEIGFQPGTGAPQPAAAGIHAVLGARVRDGGAFAFSIEIQGTDTFTMIPVGADTLLTLAADAPNPSFQGAWLPVERRVDEHGFSATWRVPSLARGFASTWTDGVAPELGEGLGVSFSAAVDGYRMTERSVKYELLLLAFVFAALWSFEVVAGLRVHPVQYGLVGAALCMFYVLELALSEHIGFGPAYAAASAVVVATVGLYGWSALHHAGRGLVVGSAVGLLLWFLYVCLNNDDYALLLGAMALQVVLGLVMLLTRRVDWYGNRATTR